MPIISITVAAAMAAAFLWSGLEKTRDLTGITNTITGLGVLHRGQRFAGLLLALTEIGIAIALIFNHEALWVHMAVIVLVLLFALAGLFAIWRGKRISCNCFNSVGSRRLGAAQVIALIPWVGCIALIRFGTLGPPSDSLSKLYLLLIVCFAIALLRAVTLLVEKRRARYDRLSAEEMFWWLR